MDSVAKVSLVFSCKLLKGLSVQKSEGFEHSEALRRIAPDEGRGAGGLLLPFLHFMALSVKFLKIRAGGFANPGGFMLYLS